MGGLCLVVDAPHAVYTAKKKGDQNFRCVYQKDVQLCLKGLFSIGTSMSQFKSLCVVINLHLVSLF